MITPTGLWCRPATEVTVDHLADELLCVSSPDATASLFKSPENTEGIGNTSIHCRLHISLSSLRMSLNIVMDTNIHLLTKFKGDTSSPVANHNIFTYIDNNNHPPPPHSIGVSQCRRLDGYHNILIVIAKCFSSIHS